MGKKKTERADFTLISTHPIMRWWGGLGKGEGKMQILTVYGNTVTLDLPLTALPMLRRWQTKNPEKEFLVTFGRYRLPLKLNEMIFTEEEHEARM